MLRRLYLLLLELDLKIYPIQNSGFHDYDLVMEGATFTESEERLATIVDYIKAKQAQSGIKLLWGTANCFSNPILVMNSNAASALSFAA